MNHARPAFPIPAVVNPEGRRHFCIPIPDHPDHLRVFAGLFHQLAEYRHWQKEITHSGTLVAQVYKEIYDAINWEGDDCMGCCPKPTNQRYTADGVFQVSYDGGETWVDAPELDPRSSGILFPPIPGVDGADKRCLGATCAEEFLKVNLIDELVTGQGYSTIFDACVVLMGILGITGIGALVAGVVAAIFTVGVIAVQAAFTSEVWADFRCILFCRIRSDGSFSESGVALVRSDILAHFTGVVSAILYTWVGALGVVGMTNAARSGMVATADCSACDDCPVGCVDPDWVILGTVVNIGDDFIDLATEPATRGGVTANWVAYGSDDDSYCCHFCSFVVLSGEFEAAVVYTCDGAPHGNTETDIRRMDGYSFGDVVVRLVFNPDGCA